MPLNVRLSDQNTSGVNSSLRLFCLTRGAGRVETVNFNIKGPMFTRFITIMFVLKIGTHVLIC